MNKKGFTLIELIVVIAILGLIASIVFPAVNSVIKGAREKSYNSQIEIVIKAAKAWGVDNIDKLPAPGEPNYELSPSKLKDENYISNDELKNPKTDENLTGKILIKCYYKAGTHPEYCARYDYEYVE